MTREENPLDGTSVTESSSNNLSAEMELHDAEEIRNHANQILLITAPSSFGENLQPGQGQSTQETDDEAEKKRFLCNQVVEEQPLTKTQQMLMDERAVKHSNKLYDLSKTNIEKSNSSPGLQESEEIRLRSNQILILTSPGANADQQPNTQHHESSVDDEKAGMRVEKESLKSASCISAKNIRGSPKSSLHTDKSESNPAQDGDSSFTVLTTVSNVTNSCTSFTPTHPVDLERNQNVRNLRSPGVIHVQGMHARRAPVSTAAVEDPDITMIEEQRDEPAVADDGTHAISVVAIARDDLEKEVHELIISKAPVGEIFDVDDVRRKDRRRIARVAGCIVCIFVVAISILIPTLLKLSKKEKEDVLVKNKLLPLLQDVSMEVFGEPDSARLALSDTESPQYKALEWMSANSDLARDVVQHGDDTTATLELLLEQYAMATLYYSTTADESGWDSEEHNFLGVDNTCEWLKNTSHCSDEGRVRVLEVAGINMTGTLPDELVFLEELERINASSNAIWGSLGPLWSVPLRSMDIHQNEFSRWDIPSNWPAIHDEFSYLDASDNALFGTIPTEVFELSNIHTLRLTRNDFTGTFPSLIGELSELTVLRLGDTSLTGTIPTELISCSNLQEINLHGTKNMTGSIPEGIWSLPVLRVLDLSGLQLIMELPGDLVPKAQRLETLSLQGGRLQGTIPTEIGLMSNLQWLNLGFNPVLTGTLPSEVGTMSQLRRLDLQNILGITGTIPTEVGNMQNLQAFVFMGTALEGQIPTEIGRLTNLFDFNGRGSLLSSSIPTEVAHLTLLRQWDQLLTRRGIGTIPTEFGLLTRLERLVLPVALEGTLPVQLSYLTELRELVVSAGRISGTIPATYGQLNKLHTLALSQHKLTGSIPLTFGALTNMRRFEIMNNTLTGTIPQNIREWRGVRRIAIQRNNFTGLAGKPLCSTWTQQYQMFGDCEEFEDGCPCCTQCCSATDFRCYPHYNYTNSEGDDGATGGGASGGGGGGRPPPS